MPCQQPKDAVNRNEYIFVKSSKIGFDFDQTLADSSQGIADCLEIVSLALARDVSRSELHRLSLSGRPLRETLLEIFDVSDVDLAMRVFLKNYPTIGVQRTKLFPGVLELFEKLRLEHYKIYILSAKTHENLILSLKHLEVDVDEAVGGLDFSGKVSFIQDLGLDFYVGDQFSDMLAASEAQSKGILVNNSSTEELLVSIHARFQDINELLCNYRSVLKI